MGCDSRPAQRGQLRRVRNPNFFDLIRLEPLAVDREWQCGVERRVKCDTPRAHVRMLAPRGPVGEFRTVMLVDEARLIYAPGAVRPTGRHNRLCKV